MASMDTGFWHLNIGSPPFHTSTSLISSQFYSGKQLNAVYPMTLPPRFVDLKCLIASSYPDFEARATNAWREIIAELDKVTKVIKEEGLNVGHWLTVCIFMRSTSNSRTVYSSDQFQLARQSFPRWNWKDQKAWECFDKRCSGRWTGHSVERWVERVRQGEWWAWNWRYSQVKPI